MSGDGKRKDADFWSDSQQPSTPHKKRTQKGFWKDDKEDENDAKEISVGNLSPGYWVKNFIKIRVTFAGSVFLSKNGNRETFNFNGIGSDEKEIAFVAWDETALKFSETVKVNLVYKVSNFTVDFSNPTYRQIENDVEIYLQSDSNIEEDLDSEFPEMQYKFSSIEKIKNMTASGNVDIIAVVGIDYGLETIKIKYSPEGSLKKDLLLTDRSKKSILFTIWGDPAKNLIVSEHDVIVARNVNFVCASGSLKYNTKGTYLQVNPTTDNALELKTWFDEALADKAKNSQCGN